MHFPAWIIYSKIITVMQMQRLKSVVYFKISLQKEQKKGSLWFIAMIQIFCTHTGD